MSDAASQADGPTPRRRLDGLPLRLAAFGTAYALLCLLGDVLTATQGDFATFWPASGLFVAALLLAPPARWRWYALVVVAAELAVGWHVQRRPVLAAAFGLADALEGLLGAALVRRAVGGPPLAQRPARDVLALVVLAGAVGSGVSALLGTSALWATYGPEKVHFSLNLVQWWSGNALGVLAVAPAVLAWSAPARLWPGWTGPRAAEAVLLAAAAAGATALVFGPAGGVAMERGYLLLPALGWAAYRSGLRGALLMGLAIAFAAAWSTSRGLPAPGPLQRPLSTDHEVQLLLAVSLSATLLFAAALEERAAAEAARRDSDALFGAFMDHSPAPLFMLGGDGRLLRGSRSFERMMGQPAEALAGRSAEEALPGEDGRTAAAEDAAVLATGTPVRVDRRIAGRTHDIVKFRIEREGHGPLIGGVAVDVTEQRQAARSLRLAQVALERTFTAVLFVEPSGRVTWANEAAGRLWARPPGELVGRPIWELDAVFDEAGWPEAWRRLRGEGAQRLEGRVGLPGAPRLEAEVGLAFVAVDGEEYVAYAARDLTERRQAEAAQRLASVGTLAAGMAHEVNNPLTFVAANLAFALDRLGPLRGDPRAEEAARALEDAEEGTRRVARVVRDLKAVSRLDPEERRPIDVRTEVETALKLAQHELRHRASVVEALGDVPRVEAAEFQLGQVVLNLLVNAAHAVGDADPDGQVVRVTTRTGPDGWAVVEVADSGGGIPDEVLPRIFEPFFTTKPLGEGTGLGLSVCHGIVTGLGGRVEVESAPGRGATFRVLLPPATGAAPPRAEAPRPRPEGARARVLVVDDEQLIGSTIRRLLSAHEVVALTDPREAMARLTGPEHFDLVLCDLMMPGLSGMELYDAVAAARPEVARRMVFMSGGAVTERARAFLDRVENPQLAKPFAPQELRDAVRGWLAAGGASG